MQHVDGNIPVKQLQRVFVIKIILTVGIAKTERSNKSHINKVTCIIGVVLVGPSDKHNSGEEKTVCTLILG